MNNCSFIGRITKDVEITTTSTGINVARFSIAVNRKFPNADGVYEADFFNIVAWRKLGENIAKYCKKGSKVFISGELQNRSYDDKNDEKRHITEIIANDCEFLDPKGEQKQEETPKKKELEEIDSDENLPF